MNTKQRRKARRAARSIPETRTRAERWVAERRTRPVAEVARDFGFAEADIRRGQVGPIYTPGTYNNGAGPMPYFFGTYKTGTLEHAAVAIAAHHKSVGGDGDGDLMIAADLLEDHGFAKAAMLLRGKVEKPGMMVGLVGSDAVEAIKNARDGEVVRLPGERIFQCSTCLDRFAAAGEPAACLRCGAQTIYPSFRPYPSQPTSPSSSDPDTPPATPAPPD